MYSLILFAYLLGSINSAIIVCKVAGLPSPRTVGSGNPGATNVLRLGSKTAAGTTLAGDVLKGIIPVILGHLLHLPAAALCWIACSAILGHIFPIYFQFKGGKGVATAMGCTFAISLWLGIFVGAIWLISAKISRYSSLSSIISISFMPFIALPLLGTNSFLPLILISAVVLFKHRSNIQKLKAGTESKIGEKTKKI